MMMMTLMIFDISTDSPSLSRSVVAAVDLGYFLRWWRHQYARHSQSAAGFKVNEIQLSPCDGAREMVRLLQIAQHVRRPCPYESA